VEAKPTPIEDEPEQQAPSTSDKLRRALAESGSQN
jgi:hypothetical protein